MSPANQVISLNITMYKVMNKDTKHGSKAYQYREGVLHVRKRLDIVHI